MDVVHVDVVAETQRGCLIGQLDRHARKPDETFGSASCACRAKPGISGCREHDAANLYGDCRLERAA
jgi:hypothetical protein